MASSPIPEVRFNESIARPIFPRPVLKHAALVRIPQTDDGAKLPTCIKPEWGDVQVFYGDYYGIIGLFEGKSAIIYGSAKEQWEAMHTLIVPGYWVKTAVPMAYAATEPCRIVTLIPTDDGSIREANFILEVGDQIVRQPGGEVQHVKAAKFGDIYFSDEEAQALGLTGMSAEQFAEWAVSEVRQSVPA